MAPLAPRTGGGAVASSPPQSGPIWLGPKGAHCAFCAHSTPCNGPLRLHELGGELACLSPQSCLRVQLKPAAWQARPILAYLPAAAEECERTLCAPWRANGPTIVQAENTTTAAATTTTSGARLASQRASKPSKGLQRARKIPLSDVNLAPKSGPRSL